MPTDAITPGLGGTVPLTQNRRFQDQLVVVQNDNSAWGIRLTTLLQSAGWIRTGVLFATAHVAAPFGWGYTSFQRLACLAGGRAYEFYNPLIEPPPSGLYDGKYPVVPVPVGPSSEASGENLAAAIGGGLSGELLIDGTLEVTATAPGFAGNNIPVIGQGSISYSDSYTAGGGEIWESASQMDLTGAGNQAKLQVQVVTSAEGGRGNPVVTAKIDGAGAVEFLPRDGNWWAAASDLMLVLISTDPFTAGDIFVWNNFFWACLPVVPTPATALADDPAGSVDVNTAGFIAQPNNSATSPALGTSPIMQCTTMLNGIVAVSQPQGQLTWSILGYHSRILGLIQPALVMLNAGAEARIVGYVPNAFLSSEYAPLLSQAFEEGRKYRVISSQTDPAGALYLAVT